MNKERQKELIEKMKYITVLDFETGRVWQYDIHGIVDENEQEITQSEQMEDYIIDAGHNLSNCEWMVHENHEIIEEDKSSWGKI